VAWPVDELVELGHDVTLFASPSFDQGSYLAFLGRLTAEKGPQDAIRIARASGMPLRIAAKLPRGETVYFKKQLEPHIDGRAVQLVGEVDEAKKQPFLAGAAALLFPIDWPEPFGLVMIEAMACGTPVIERGAICDPRFAGSGPRGPVNLQKPHILWGFCCFEGALMLSRPKIARG
jgi:glycosyltransferase involved in cell wall biosynthesis